MKPTDAALLQKWTSRRDGEAFREILSRHADMVYATCKRILRDTALAEDTAQECFLRLAQRDVKLRRSLGAWLHTVATRCALDLLRSNRRRRHHEETYGKTNAVASRESWGAVQGFVDEAIEVLPEKLRDPIVRHFLQGASQQSIATALGVTRSAVSRRVKEGLARIRANLQKHGLEVSVAALAAQLSATSVEAAPASLTATLGKIALSGVVVSESSIGGVAVTSLGGLFAMKKVIVSLTLAVLAITALWLLRERLDTSVPPSPPEVIMDAPSTPAEPVEPATAQPARPESPAPETPGPGLVVEPVLGTVLFRIVDGVQGAGLDGIPLSLRAVPPIAGVRGVFQADSEESRKGLYVFTSLPLGAYKPAFDVSKMDYVPPGYFRAPGLDLVRLTRENPKQEITIELEPGGAISGTVTAENGPVVLGAKLRLVSTASSFIHDFERDQAYMSYETWEVASDAEGAYRFSGLRPGTTFRVLASAPDHAAGVSVAVVLSEPVERSGIDVVVVRGRSASGRFLDDDGQPIPDLGVRLARDFSHTSSSFGLPEAHTDAGGRFEFRGLAAGPYIVYPRTRGHHTSWHTSRQLSFVMPDEGDASDLVFTLERKHEGFLSGRVVDARGIPISHVEVSLHGKDGARVFEQKRTGADGRYLFEDIGQSTVFDVSIYRSGYAGDERRGVAVNSPNVDFKLERHAGVGGRIVDATTGEAIPAFEVRTISFRFRPHGMRGSWRELVSESGEFFVDELEPPESQLEFRAPGYGTATTDRFRLQPSQKLTGITVQLFPAPALEGEVIDARTGEALPDTSVRLFETHFRSTFLRDGEAPIEGETHFTTTDASGRFRFESFDRERANGLVAWRKGYAALVVEPAPSGEPNVLALAPESRLTVRTVRGGAPALDLMVGLLQLGQPNARLAYRGGRRQKTGTATFAELPAGRYRILIENEDGLVGFVRRELVADAHTEVELDLDDFDRACGAVAGTLTGAEGGVWIHLEAAADPTDRVGVRSSDSGVFALRGIPPGDYVLRFPSPPGASGDHSRKIQIHAGETKHVTSEIR